MLCNTQQRQTASNYTQTYGDNSVEAANTNLNTNPKTNPNTNPNTNPKTNPNTNIVTTVMLSQWASHGVVWHLTHYTSSALDHIFLSPTFQMNKFYPVLYIYIDDLTLVISFFTFLKVKCIKSPFL